MAPRKKSRTLLIDADVYAYKAAAAEEVATDWGDDYWTWHCDAGEVKKRIDRMIEQTMDALGGTRAILCLTSPDRNWRLDLLPTYKGNRSGSKRPLVLRHIKEWMVEEREALTRTSLEGDDILGILATGPSVKGEKIIVSLDKDMRTIPGLYCRDALADVPHIETITADAARRTHLCQTLSGDATDGYAGCPGVGVAKAKAIIEGGLRKVEYRHEVLRGPRKGEVEIRYDEEPDEDLWRVVVSHYAAAGLTEDDALIQARVAHILTHDTYNSKKKEPILWTPTSTP